MNMRIVVSSAGTTAASANHHGLSPIGFINQPLASCFVGYKTFTIKHGSLFTHKRNTHDLPLVIQASVRVY